MQIMIFLKDAEGTYVAQHTCWADAVLAERAKWNTNEPDQHGTEMEWEYTPERHIVLSKLGTLLVDSSRYRVRCVSFDGLVYLDEVEPREMPQKEPLFALGAIVATPAAMEVIGKAGVAPSAFLDRHVRGDWGDVCADDKVMNHVAVKLGNRILSAYTTSKGDALWVITESDRATTTLLLPNEY